MPGHRRKACPDISARLRFLTKTRYINPLLLLLLLLLLCPAVDRLKATHRGTAEVRCGDWCALLGANWRNLVKTTEPSVCGGDAALCQITLTACLWPPYVIGQAIYIFILWFLLLSFFFPLLISAAGDWMSTILPHMVWP